ncbi:hypothetical protein [Paeniglutamicibacter cryotolerans]|uniref:Uncharacterized protein n=1 Tax=Paeniglutamicibacter cryotolerans TaxID=670079 RepID=A0A839QJ12_9MICC|nr:hypothetical protein [Paeniglutamicibacter cryotolerans]MBB2995593.1 hypothetical protein [Paeniglutamicibacter cryotolerans]
MSTQSLDRAEAGMAAFEASTSRWGRITMLAGLVLSLIGPIYLVVFGGLDITSGQIWIAFLAVAATFGVFWIVEPLTYFPILGSAAMYQAFMIGNISNKLLPAAIVAQSSIGARPGTKRGDLAAVMAICGAATVHLTSLLIFVGLLGTWLMTRIPPGLIEVARLYILPALMGAVLIQCIATMKQIRPTVIALALALVVQFALVPALPKAAMFATAIVVVCTILASWFLRNRNIDHTAAIEDIPAIQENEVR